MSYEIFIIIGLVCISIGIFIGTKILQRKGIISKEDVLLIAKFFDLGLDIIKELKLEKEGKILLIGDIVNDGIQYVIAVFDNKDFDELVSETYNFVVEKCEQFNIELNENRINIIDTLIHVGLQNALDV